MEDTKTPRLKLVCKQEYEELKSKYDFYSEDIKTKIAPIIEAAAPSDILALTVIAGSGLKILNAEIFNEEKEDVFIKLLKEGVGEVKL